MMPISRILISSTDILLDALKPGKGEIGLRDNQIVEATVVKVLPQGKALLQIDGQQVEAQARMPLTENDTLYLKVTRDDGKTVLKLVEAYTSPSTPDGLSEMRNLGREGPYSNLTKLMNPPLEKTTLTQTPAVLEPKGGYPIEKLIVTGDKQGLANPVVKTDPVLPDVKSSPDMGKPPVLKTETPMRSDRDLLNAFVTDKKIPFELKLAVLVSKQPQGKSPVPETIRQDLSEKLLKILPDNKPVQSEMKNTAPESGVSLKNQVKDTPSESVETPLSRLKKIAVEMVENLGTNEKMLVNKLMETPSFSMEEKSLSLVLSQKPDMLSEKDIQPLKEALVKILQAGTPEKGIQASSVRTTNPVTQILETVEKLMPKIGDQELPDGIAVVKKIKDLLQTLSLKPGESFDGASLKNVVRDSGLMWENKIREFVDSIRDKDRSTVESLAKKLVDNDVKALAMKGTDHSDVPPKIVESLRTFVDSLEKMQLLNSHTSDDGGRYLLPLPFFSGETLKFGQLFIDLDTQKESGKKGGDRIVRVAFILEMTHLGHIQADVSIYKKTVSGEFLVGDNDAKALLDEAVPELKAELAKKGYVLRKLDSRVEDPLTLSQTSLTERLVKKETSSVNILI